MKNGGALNLPMDEHVCGHKRFIVGFCGHFAKLFVLDLLIESGEFNQLSAQNEETYIFRNDEPVKVNLRSLRD